MPAGMETFPEVLTRLPKLQEALVVASARWPEGQALVAGIGQFQLTHAGFFQGGLKVFAGGPGPARAAQAVQAGVGL